MSDKHGYQADAKSMNKRKWWLALPIVGGILLAALAASALSGDEQLPMWQVRIVQVYPHDPGAFSQGLVIEDGVLYEGTGQYGNSFLRRVELTSGRVEAQQSLGDKLFGEGITICDGKIYQLTWKAGVCIVYDQETLAAMTSFRYRGEGWGLADDGKHLYMSDGSSTIRVIDPTNFTEVRRLRVKNGRRSVDKLNELEFVNGEIYANIWYSDVVARISPKTGEVLGWIDMSRLWPASQRPTREHVLNGLAFDEQSERLFVTGKNWPKLFEVEVIK